MSDQQRDSRFQPCFLVVLMSMLCYIPIQAAPMTSQCAQLYTSTNSILLTKRLKGFPYDQTQITHLEYDLMAGGHILYSTRDSIYRMDRGHNSTVRLFPRSAFTSLTSFSQINRTHLVVVDSSAHCLKMLNRQTKRIKSLTGNCRQSGYRDGDFSIAMFDRPLHVAKINNDTLAVSDFFNRAVRLLNLRTKDVSTFADVYIDFPLGLAVDTEKQNLFVSTTDGVLMISIVNKKINKLSLNSQHRIGEVFRRPADLAMLTNNTLLVADTGNHLLKVVDVVTQEVQALKTKQNMDGQPTSLLVLDKCEGVLWGDDKGSLYLIHSSESMEAKSEKSLFGRVFSFFRHFFYTTDTQTTPVTIHSTAASKTPGSELPTESTGSSSQVTQIYHKIFSPNSSQARSQTIELLQTATETQSSSPSPQEEIVIAAWEQAGTTPNTPDSQIFQDMPTVTTPGMTTSTVPSTTQYMSSKVPNTFPTSPSTTDESTEPLATAIPEEKLSVSLVSDKTQPSSSLARDEQTTSTGTLLEYTTSTNQHLLAQAVTLSTSLSEMTSGIQTTSSQGQTTTTASEYNSNTKADYNITSPSPQHPSSGVVTPTDKSNTMLENTSSNSNLSSQPANTATQAVMDSRTISNPITSTSETVLENPSPVTSTPFETTQQQEQLEQAATAERNLTGIISFSRINISSTAATVTATATVTRVWSRITKFLQSDTPVNNISKVELIVDNIIPTTPNSLLARNLTTMPATSTSVPGNLPTATLVSAESLLPSTTQTPDSKPPTPLASRTSADGATHTNDIASTPTESIIGHSTQLSLDTVQLPSQHTSTMQITDTPILYANTTNVNSVKDLSSNVFGVETSTKSVTGVTESSAATMSFPDIVNLTPVTPTDTPPTMAPTHPSSSTSTVIDSLTSTSSPLVPTTHSSSSTMTVVDPLTSTSSPLAPTTHPSPSTMTVVDPLTSTSSPLVPTTHSSSSTMTVVDPLTSTSSSLAPTTHPSPSTMTVVDPLTSTSSPLAPTTHPSSSTMTVVDSLTSTSSPLAPTTHPTSSTMIVIDPLTSTSSPLAPTTLHSSTSPMAEDPLSSTSSLLVPTTNPLASTSSPLVPTTTLHNDTAPISVDPLSSTSSTLVPTATLHNITTPISVDPLTSTSSTLVRTTFHRATTATVVDALTSTSNPSVPQTSIEVRDRSPTRETGLNLSVSTNSPAFSTEKSTTPISTNYTKSIQQIVMSSQPRTITTPSLVDTPVPHGLQKTNFNTQQIDSTTNTNFADFLSTVKGINSKSDAVTTATFVDGDLQPGGRGVSNIVISSTTTSSEAQNGSIDSTRSPRASTVTPSLPSAQIPVASENKTPMLTNSFVMTTPNYVSTSPYSSSASRLRTTSSLQYLLTARGHYRTQGHITLNDNFKIIPTLSPIKLSTQSATKTLLMTLKRHSTPSKGTTLRANSTNTTAKMEPAELTPQTVTQREDNTTGQQSTEGYSNGALPAENSEGLDVTILASVSVVVLGLIIITILVVVTVVCTRSSRTNCCKRAEPEISYLEQAEDLYKGARPRKNTSPTASERAEENIYAEIDYSSVTVREEPYSVPIPSAAPPEPPPRNYKLVAPDAL